MKIHNKHKGVFSTSKSQALYFNWRMSFFIGNAEGFFLYCAVCNVLWPCCLEDVKASILFVSLVLDEYV